jgi:uncharacterized cupredoxin-like copper-binding protein
VIVALTTENKILLGGTALIFIVFALASAFLIPRYRPDYPGRRLGLFVVVCIALFVAMMAAVELFAVEEEAAEAHGAAAETDTGAIGTQPEEPAQPSGEAATDIDVGATEFRFELAEQPDAAGNYVFELTNEGDAPHDLVVEGPGVDGEKTPVLDPGESAELEVDLQSGEYVLYCSVPGHRPAGMETTVEIE